MVARTCVAMAFVSCSIFADVPGEWELDPTPTNPWVCNNLLVPASTGAFQFGTCSSGNLPGYPPGLGSPGTWVDGQWTRDRRPAIFLQLYNGNYTVNPRGLKEEWHMSGVTVDQPIPHPSGHPGQFAWLDDVMRRYHAEGFRRFILQLPGGVAFGWPRTETINTGTGTITREFFTPQNQPMAQWFTMPEWKRDYFNNPFGLWKQFLAEFPEVNIEIYIGSGVAGSRCTPCVTPNSFTPAQEANAQQIVIGYEPDGSPITRQRWVTSCVGVSPEIAFDPRNQSHMNFLVENVTPWIGAGVKRFWMDGMEPNCIFPPTNVDERRRWEFTELSYMPFFRSQGITFGAETIPALNCDGEVPDDCSLNLARWLGLSQVVTNWGENNPARTFKPAFVFNRLQTEVHMLLNNNRSYRSGNNTVEEPIFTLREIGQARRRGLVITLFKCEDEPNFAATRQHCEVMKRWYTMGKIYIPDFNGDSRVDNQDLIDYDYEFYSPAPPLGWYNVMAFGRGDIDADGQLELDQDRNQFLLLHAAHVALYGSTIPQNPPAAWFGHYGEAND